MGCLGERNVRTVTLPQLSFLAEPVAIGEAAERFMEIRNIRKGRDAFEQMSKAGNFSAWYDIGAALAVGREHALKITRSNSANGQLYNKAFSAWIKTHGFDSMPKSARCAALELHENISQITAWRETLSPKRRDRLRCAHSNVWAWRRATASPKANDDPHRNALEHWRRFTACLAAMPPDEAAELWSTLSWEMMPKPWIEMWA
jgi:hypothetical protein